MAFLSCAHLAYNMLPLLILLLYFILFRFYYYISRGRKEEVSRKGDWYFRWSNFTAISCNAFVSYNAFASHRCSYNIWYIILQIRIRQPASAVTLRWFQRKFQARFISMQVTIISLLKYEATWRIWLLNDDENWEIASGAWDHALFQFHFQGDGEAAAVFIC